MSALNAILKAIKRLAPTQDDYMAFKAWMKELAE